MTRLAGSLAAQLIRGYQLVLRPLLPPACRFEPSCSEYARQAFLIHGIARGLGLATRRILRCHPFNQGGYDPLPLAGPERRAG